MRNVAHIRHGGGYIVRARAACIWKGAEDMRRQLKFTIGVAASGLLFGALFRYIFNDPAEASLANYLRSALHGAGLALSGWAVHLYFMSAASEWVRRRPLVAELLIRSVVMAIVVAAVAVGLEALLYGHRIGESWLVTDYPKIVGMSFAGSMLFGAIYEL